MQGTCWVSGLRIARIFYEPLLIVLEQRSSESGDMRMQWPRFSVTPVSALAWVPAFGRGSRGRAPFAPAGDAPHW
jgi:hypothetical protein